MDKVQNGGSLTNKYDLEAYWINSVNRYLDPNETPNTIYKSYKTYSELTDNKIMRKHGESGDNSLLRINDILLTIPPENIAINISERKINMPNLRTQHTVSIDTNHTEVAIQLSLVFTDNPYFQTSMEDEIINKMMPLLTQITYMPFFEMENEFLRKHLITKLKEINYDTLSLSKDKLMFTYNGHAIMPDQNTPRATRLTLNLLLFNYLPYADSIKYVKNYETFNYKSEENVSSNNTIFKRGNSGYFKTPGLTYDIKKSEAFNQFHALNYKLYDAISQWYKIYNKPSNSIVLGYYTYEPKEISFTYDDIERDGLSGLFEKKGIMSPAKAMAIEANKGYPKAGDVQKVAFYDETYYKAENEKIDKFKERATDLQTEKISEAVKRYISNPSTSNPFVLSGSILKFIIDKEGYSEFAYPDVDHYSIGHGTRASVQKVLNKGKQLLSIKELASIRADKNNAAGIVFRTEDIDKAYQLATLSMTRGEAEIQVLTHIQKEVFYQVKNSISAPITMNMFNALISHFYNRGAGESNVNGIVSFINDGDYQGAANKMLSYFKDVNHNIVPALKIRRVDEAKLFLLDIPKELLNKSSKEIVEVDYAPINGDETNKGYDIEFPDIAFTAIYYLRTYNEHVVKNIIIDSYEVNGNVTIPRVPLAGHRLATHQYLGGREDTIALKIVSADEQLESAKSSILEFNQILDKIHNNLSKYKDLSLMDGIIIKDPFLNTIAPGVFFSVDSSRIETIPEIPGGEAMLLQATNITKMRTHFYTSNMFSMTERYTDSDIIHKFIDEIFTGTTLELEILSASYEIEGFVSYNNVGTGIYTKGIKGNAKYKISVINYPQNITNTRKAVIDDMLKRLESAVGNITDKDSFFDKYGVTKIVTSKFTGTVKKVDIDLSSVFRSKDVIKVDVRDALWSGVQANLGKIYKAWPSLGAMLKPNELGLTTLDFVDQITESAYSDFYLPPTLNPDFYFYQESKYHDYDFKTQNTNNDMVLNNEQYNKALKKYEEQFDDTRLSDILSSVVIQTEFSAKEKEQNEKEIEATKKVKNSKNNDKANKYKEVTLDSNKEQDIVKQTTSKSLITGANYMGIGNASAYRDIQKKRNKKILENTKGILRHSKSAYNIALDDNKAAKDDDAINSATPGNNTNTSTKLEIDQLADSDSMIARIATWNVKFGTNPEDLLYAEELLLHNSIVVFNEIYNMNIDELDNGKFEIIKIEGSYGEYVTNEFKKWGTSMFIKNDSFESIEIEDPIKYHGNRDAIHAIVTTKSNKKISIVGVHFPSGQDVSNANFMLADIRNQIQLNFNSDLIIVLGDFNNVVASEYSGFSQAVVENTYYSSKNADTASFDNILISKGAYSTETYTETTSSDHKAITTAIIFGEKQELSEAEQLEIESKRKDSEVVGQYNIAIDNGVRDRLTLLNAFPAFKVYILEDDDEEMFAWMRHDLNEMFGLNAVAEIDFIEHADQPADLLMVKFIDVSKKFTSAKYRDKPKTEKKPTETLNTIAENRLTGIVLKPGTRVQFKAGYGNDVQELPTKFNGLIASVEGDGMQYEMQCQSFGVEAIYDVKNPNKNSDITDFNPGTWEILNWALAQPEMVHFGKWKLMSSSNLQMTDSKFGFGLGGLVFGEYGLAPDFKRIRADGRITDRLWVYTRSNADQNLFTPITEEFDRLSSQLAEHPLKFNDWFDQIFSDFDVNAKTPWEIIDEMTYRYPGYVAKVLPYEDRVTLYFGPPTGLYYNRAFTFRERLIAGATYFEGNDRLDLLTNLRNRTVRKFQKKWFVSSHKNLCYNRIRADYKDVYTRVVVNYGDSGDSVSLKLNQFLKAEEVRTKVLLAPNAPLEVTGHEAEITVNGKLTKISFGGAYDYGTAELWKQSKKLYKGTFGIIINSDIKPYDSIFLVDSSIGMGGNIEVKDHIINISQYSGMISSIVPSMSSHVSTAASMTMSDFEDIATSSYEINQVIENTTLTKEQIEAMSNKYNSNVLKALNSPRKAMAGAAGISIASSLIFGSMATGALIPFAGVFILTTALLISLRTTAFNMAKYTDSIYLRPLLMHGIPYMYGLDTYKMGTLAEFEADQLKMVYEAVDVIKYISSNTLNSILGIAKQKDADV